MKILKIKIGIILFTIVFLTAIVTISLFLDITPTSAEENILVENQSMLEEIPSAPTTFGPTGECAIIRPEYSWSEVSGGNDYHLFISHAAIGTVINEWIDATDLCSDGTCRHQHITHLRTGNHSWWVRVSTSGGTSDWSTQRNFKVINYTPPTGSVTQAYPINEQVWANNQVPFAWWENTRASWYKVYMTDSEGKLYNQYHRAADICMSTSCSLSPEIYEPLFYAPRGLSHLPASRWIHWNVMPVNVAGNGDWSGYEKFWITP